MPVTHLALCQNLVKVAELKKRSAFDEKELHSGMGFAECALLSIFVATIST
jgi:hypothetical protein